MTRPEVHAGTGPLTFDAMRAAVAEMLDESAGALDENANLIEWGLDSVKVIQLANRFRRASGRRVKFVQLLETPTLARWREIVCADRDEPDNEPDNEPREAADSPPARTDPSAPFELTPVQYAYWIGRGEGQVLGNNSCHYYAEFDGRDVNPRRLADAVRALIQRHGMLRAHFAEPGVQWVADDPGSGLTVLDLRSHGAEDARKVLSELRAQLSHRRLAVERGEVIEVALTMLPDSSCRTHVNVDLLVADALSIKNIMRDLAHLYAFPADPLPRLEITFAEYVAGRYSGGREQWNRARDYWSQKLDRMPTGPELPRAVAAESIEHPRFVRRETWLGPSECARLTARCHGNGVTVAMALATAFSEVVGAWSASGEFLLNVPFFDRDSAHPDVDRIVGDFTNLILLTVNLAGRGSFRSRAHRLQAEFREAATHAEYSSVEVLRDLRRRMGDAQVFAPVVFTSALGMGELYNDVFRGTIGRPGWMISQAPQVWLDHQVSEFGGGLLLNWDAVEGLFAPGVLDGMFSAYTQLLEWLSTHDWEEDVPPLLPDAQAAVRARVNATDETVRSHLLHAEFFRVAADAGEAAAVLWGAGEVLTYRQLDRWARQVARALLERGVRAGERVGVLVEKGPAQLAAVLGVLAAGGAYVPVGVDQPGERRARILATAGVRVVLVSAGGGAQPPGVEVVSLDQVRALTPLDDLVAVTGDQVAYVIFTSGSTGAPKGVMVTHGAAMNTVEDINTRFQVGVSDRVLAVSALDFDLSVYDIFGPLSVGGAVVLVAEDERREPVRWLELVRDRGVTLWNSVPALLDMLLVVAKHDDLAPSLRLAMVSGDWVPLDLPGRLAAQRPGCRLVALGGATEASIWSNAFEVARVDPTWSSIPYGYPLRNQRFRVVDSRGRDCPDWVPGELWIGGMGVAAGYQGDPETTAAKFVEYRGQRWYRTGDLGRYWPDGRLEFLGRIDHQVKIRGHRIELGEIETALEAHESVERAVVTTSEGGAAQLHAFVTMAGGGPPVVDEGWRQELEQLSALTPAAEPDPRLTEWEATLVDVLLGGLLGPVVGDRCRENELATRLDADHAGAHLVGRWVDWLVDRRLLARADGVLQPRQRCAELLSGGLRSTLVRDAPTPGLGRVAQRLFAADLLGVLRAEAQPLMLLDDPVLAPDALASQHPVTAAAVDAIAAQLDRLATATIATATATAATGRPLRIAELGAGGGRTARRVLTRLRAAVSYTLLDEGSRLAGARDFLADRPEALDYAETGGELAPERLHRRFDVVLANNALHRYPDPATGPALSALLLKPGGVLCAVESTTLSPLGLVTTAVLGLHAARHGASADVVPGLLDGRQWAELLGRHGFARTEQWSWSGRNVVLRARLREDVRRVHADDLLDDLRDRLPGYMVPAHVTVVPKVPLGANGKVDRAAIRRWAQRPGAADPALDRPFGPIETALANIWSDLLGAPVVGRNHSFFALGGDSLLATRLMSRLTAAGLAGGLLRALFRSPVLKDFAQTLRRAASSGTSELAADHANRFEPFPATDVQRAYLLGRADDFVLGGVGAYWYTEFDCAEVDLPALERAVNRLIARHEMLRAVFDGAGGQRILPEVPWFTIPVVHGGARELDELRARMASQVLDPSRSPLFDIRAVRYERSRTRIGIGLDNVILDGLSMMIFLSELGACYADSAATLPPLQVSFRDYVLATRAQSPARERAEQYWRARLETLPPAPALPLRTDPARLGTPTFRRRSAVVPSPSWRRIVERARQYGVTPAAVVLACYAKVLADWSGRAEVTVNLTLFDRREVHPDINNVLGDFTSLLLVGFQPQPGDSWLATVRRLQEQLWSDLEHRAVSGIWVLRELAKRTGRADVGMPVVFTSGIGVADGLADPVTPFGERVYGISQTPQVWLDHQVAESGGALALNWDAVDALFAGGVLDGMFADYVRQVQWLATGDWRGPAPPSRVPDQYRTADRDVPVGPPGPGDTPDGQTRDGQTRDGEPGDDGNPDAAPQGDLECALAAIWSEVLGIDAVGRGRSFVTLGGDSLSATRFVTRVRERYGVGFLLRELVGAPTVAAQAAVIAPKLGELASGLVEEGAV